MQLGVKLFQNLSRSCVISCGHLMKSRIELTEMASSVVAIGFSHGNVLCHVRHNLANING
jgi:hypothetical protein